MNVANETGVGKFVIVLWSIRSNEMINLSFTHFWDFSAIGSMLSAKCGGCNGCFDLSCTRWWHVYILLGKPISLFCKLQYRCSYISNDRFLGLGMVLRLMIRGILSLCHTSMIPRFVNMQRKRNILNYWEHLVGLGIWNINILNLNHSKVVGCNYIVDISTLNVTTLNLVLLSRI